MLQHTPGPWEWFTKGDGDRPYLATPDRGRLYVMGFGRKGMQGATPRFSHWDGIYDGAPRGRAGGIMHDGILLPFGRLHPDARLIAAAPRLLEALERCLAVMEQHEQLAGCDSIVGEEAREAIAAARGVR